MIYFNSTHSCSLSYKFKLYPVLLFPLRLPPALPRHKQNPRPYWLSTIHYGKKNGCFFRFGANLAHFMAKPDQALAFMVAWYLRTQLPPEAGLSVSPPGQVTANSERSPQL
jgi:hypothetical protein